MKYVLLYLLVMSIALHAEDTIYRRDGSVLHGVKILQDTYKEVTYLLTTDEKSIKIPLNLATIKWIEYGDAPREFIDGRNAIQQGLYNTAITKLTASLEIAQKAPVVGKWINEYAYYYLAQAYQQMGDSIASGAASYQRALKYYQKVIDANSQTRFLLACYFYSAQCYYHLQAFTDVKKQLAKLLQLCAQDNDQYAAWKFRALLWMGHYLSAAQKQRSALDKYREAEQFADNRQQRTWHHEALAAIGNWYIAGKDYNGAEQHFMRMLRSQKKNPEYIVAAKNGLAASYLAQDKIISALNLVIEIIHEYPQAEKQRAHTFFIAAQCYEKLASRETGSRKRAQYYYQLVKIANSKSEWARKANKRLETLQIQK